MTRKTMRTRWCVSSAIFVVTACGTGLAMADALDTRLPVNINIPAQTLGTALRQFASQTGKNIVFDKALVNGKTSPGVKGQYDDMEALKRVLVNSGLEAQQEDDTIVIQPARQPEKKSITTDKVEVTASRFKQIGPMPGLNLTREEIPGNVQSITAEEIKQSKATTMAELLNSKMQSINVNDYQGNPFQMDITYRGFTASPQIGTSQGLSVFFDGIRVNEPFGDIVNWDLIPMNALAGLDVFPGSNPIFGLNTLGGAIAVRTKNGFDDPGTDAQVLTGAWGRKQVMLSTGGSKDYLGWYLAMNRFDEDGWRNNSASTVNQIFGKLSFRNDHLDLHGSMMYAGNKLVGNGLIPQEMYREDPTSVFTSPDKTKNKLLQFQLAGNFQVTDNISITGQAYHRKSDRTANTADVNRDFANYGGAATRRPTAGEKPVCAFASTNSYGIPNYFIADESAIFGVDSSVFDEGFLLGAYNSVADYLATVYADPDPDIQAQNIQAAMNPSFITTAIVPPGSTPEDTDPIGKANFDAMMASGKQSNANMFHGNISRAGYYSFEPSEPLNGPDTDGDGIADWKGTGRGGGYYQDGMGVRHYIVLAPALNGVVDAFDPTSLPYTQQCGGNGIDSATGRLGNDNATGNNATKLLALDAAGDTIRRNGAFSGNGSTFGTDTGYIDGTPTAVITNTVIKQVVKGGSMQFNLDEDRHKLMFGLSHDEAKDTYTSSQMLGLLTAERKGYVSASQVGAEFSIAQVPLSNNNFSGGSKTNSAYLSETFSPTDSLHLSFSGRYNYTDVFSTTAARHRNTTIDLMDYQSSYMDYLLCSGSTQASCDQQLLHGTVLDARLLDGNLMDPAETEAFSYHKLNPAIGASWSPTSYLNLYANWNQGTRAPSAIELGCAYDGTIVTVHTLSGDKTGPRSLVNGRSCTLPTAMSGDPYLPQVVARTSEFGARGTLANGWEWNASVYRTNLQDDIYYVAYTSTQSFFDTIGRTRRQGLELGLSGKQNRWDFKINYAISEATFESKATILSADNSAVNHNSNAGQSRDMMTINPGNVMPGMPKFNGNLTIGYQASDKWHIGLGMVAHSWSYARGNENNQHHAAVLPWIVTDNTGHYQTLTRNYLGNGKTPGYAVFNLNTDYDFGGGWLGTLSITNLLDKEYFSASQLNINPFVTGQYGVTDASGFNYNSRDWNSTTFVGPGAPRALWLTLKYDFGADKR